MRPPVEIAFAKIAYPGKGHDDCCVREVAEGTWLLAVADGLTMNNGAAAAHWAIEHLRKTEAYGSVRALYADLRDSLQRSTGAYTHSETTLTAGILTLIQDAAGERLHFNFFAAGDSPIWCIFRSDREPRYQRHEVHGSAYPGELGSVYSTLRLGMGDIVGRVAFGSVEVARDEVLVICSDGVPERTVFEWDFMKRSRRPRDIRLCEWLYAPAPYTENGLTNALSGYLKRGELSDDATMIAIRLSSRTSGEGAVSSDGTHDADGSTASTLKAPSDVGTPLSIEGGAAEESGAAANDAVLS